MKVAIYSGSLPSTTFIERLIEKLAQNEVAVLLHGAKSGNVRYSTKKIKVVGYSGNLSRIRLASKYYLLFLASEPAKLKLLKEIHRQSRSSQSFLKWFVRVAPIVWHRPDVFHLQWAKGVEEWLFLREFGIKFVVSLRGAHINYSPLADESLADTYRRSFPEVDAFHGVSSAICEEAGKYGAEASKCRVVYSGLDLSEFPYRNEKSLDRKKLKIVSVGRAHWKKGYNFALDAMKILRERGVDFDYTIIGGKDEELIFQRADLGLEDSVALEENVPFAVVKATISEADALLLPSVEEGIPNVVLEAMALGTLAISTDCGGIAEVIEDGVNGFTVPVRCPQAMADKIAALLDRSDEELNSIRARARATIERQHNHQKMVDDMIALYESLL